MCKEFSIQNKCETIALPHKQLFCYQDTFPYFLRTIKHTKLAMLESSCLLIMQNNSEMRLISLAGFEVKNKVNIYTH